MKKILLSNGGFAIVDKEDFEYLNQWKWTRHNAGYAIRSIYKNGTRFMHRQILNTPKGMETDHINGDRLDNRRENLRMATHQENCRNMRPLKNKSGYKGVQWYKRDQRWVAFLTVNDKHIYLGYFDDPKDAAEAYNKGAKKYFGEFARLNQL